MILSENWLIDEPIDFEYKQYALLAFEQNCYKALEGKKLFPYVSLIRQHYDYIQGYILNKKFLQESNKEIDYLDFVNKQVVYKSKFFDVRLNDIDQIAYYGEKILSKLWLEAKDILGNIQKILKVEQVSEGLNFKQGYFIISSKDLEVYKYQIDRFYCLNNDEKHKNISSTTIQCNTNFTDVINELNKHSRQNIFYVETNLPIESCVLPITKITILDNVNKYLPK